MRLKGLIAAPHTPFNDEGQLWLEAIDRQAAFLSEQPVTGVFIAGSTGECTSLSVEERIRVCERWVQNYGNGNRKIVVHVGTNCVPDSIELAAHAASLGVDAVASFAPSYFRPASVDDLIAFLEPIAAAADHLPFYYYDIPALTRVVLPMLDFLERAPSRIPNLNGLKYTNNDLVQLRECFDRFGDAFDLVFGCDELLMAGLTLGVQAAIGSTYNFASPLFEKIVNAMRKGDDNAARDAQRLGVALIDKLSESEFISASKAAMRIIGVDCGGPRPPLRAIGDSAYQELHGALAELGLAESLERTHG